MPEYEKCRPLLSTKCEDLWSIAAVRMTYRLSLARIQEINLTASNSIENVGYTFHMCGDVGDPKIKSKFHIPTLRRSILMSKRLHWREASLLVK